MSKYDSHLALPARAALLLTTAFAAAIFVSNPASAEEKTGIVKITSEPAGATVKVGKRVYGKTPVLLELPAKKQKIVVFKAGFEDTSKSIVVTPNKVLRAHVKLKAAVEREPQPGDDAAKILVHKLEESNEPGTVTIVTTPPGLTVFMNDYLVPQPTPVAFDLRAGIYEMVIEDEDGTTVHKKTVFVYPGRTLSLELDIKKIRRIDYEDPWK